MVTGVDRTVTDDLLGDVEGTAWAGELWVGFRSRPASADDPSETCRSCSA